MRLCCETYVLIDSIFRPVSKRPRSFYTQFTLDEIARKLELALYVPTLCVICTKVRTAVFIEFPVLSGVYLILLALATPVYQEYCVCSSQSEMQHYPPPL